MKELVLFIAKQLAGHPDQISVTETEQEGTIELELCAAEEDKGKIIGKQGKVIKAIRAVVQAAAAQQNKRVIVEIN